jgi:magnesium transporter
VDGQGRRRRPPRPARRGQHFTWVDLSEYGEEDLRAVGDALRLEQGLGRTAGDGWRGPALDVFRDHVYLGATVAHPDGPSGQVQASQLDLFVGRAFLVSAHQRPLPFADRLLARARRSPELVPLEAAFLLYLVLDELLAYYEGLSGPVEDQIERMEERALTETAEAVLTDILRLKRYLFALGRLVEQHRPVFAAFGRPDLPFVPRDVVDPYYRDLQRRLERLLDMLRAAQEAVNGTFDIYVSHMAHRTNNVMRLLTIVSTVLLPASIILALFSTSFEGLPLYTPTAFALMLLALVAVTAAILVTFRRNGWF